MKFKGLILTILTITSFQVFGSSYIDSLQIELSMVDSDVQYTKWVDLAILLGEEMIAEGKYNEAYKVFEEALLISKKNKLQEKIPYIKVQQAWLVHQSGEYILSNSMLSQVFSNIDKDDTKSLGLFYLIKGMNNIYLDNYSEALEQQEKGIEIYEELNDITSTIRVYLGLGNSFFHQKQYSTALEYFNKALNICEEAGMPEGIHRAYSAISKNYSAEGDLEKALEYNKKALKIVQKSDNEEIIAQTRATLGATLNNSGKYNEALRSYKLGLKTATKLGNKKLEGHIYEGIADSYFLLKNYNRSIHYLKKSYDIRLSNNDRNNIASLYDKFAKSFYEKRNYEQSEVYNEKFIALSDSLSNENNIEQEANLKKFKVVQPIEQKGEIELFPKNTKLKQPKKGINITSWIGGFIILLLMLLLYIQHERNRSVREQNIMLKQKNDVIIRQNKTLAGANRDLEKYAEIVAHDLKEPLRNISSFTALLKRRIGSQLDETSLDYMNFIVNGVNQMDNLLIDLLQYSKISIHDKTYDNVNTRTLLSSVVDSMQLIIDKENAVIKLPRHLPTVRINESLLFQIFRNLIVNALKFRSQAPPKIAIHSTQSNKEYIFSVQDNGIGVDPKYFEQIFIVFKRLHNREEYTGSGIGLAICKKIIEERGGRIWIESELNKGATLYFTIPKAD